MKIAWIERLKARFRKAYVPRADIPEQNDKEKAADKKNNWDAALLVAVEFIFLFAMFSFGQFISQFGLLLGGVITVIMVFVPLFFIVFLKMRATVNRSNQLGQYTPINLIAFNLEGKKYEDHFFLERLERVEAKNEEIQLDEEGKNPENLNLGKGDAPMIYLPKGAFRKHKPLEEYAVLTKQEWGTHIEFSDATETVNLGSVALKKDMPTVVLRQIGTYGKNKLPLMRVESSCVSRRDQKLFSASMQDVVAADHEIDKYRSVTMEEDVVRLEKTLQSKQETIDKLKDARERDKKERDQRYVIGEEGERESRKKPSWQVALPYISVFIAFGLGAAITFFILRVVFGVPIP